QNDQYGKDSAQDDQLSALLPLLTWHDVRLNLEIGQALCHGNRQRVRRRESLPDHCQPHPLLESNLRRRISIFELSRPVVGRINREDQAWDFGGGGPIVF